MENNKIEFKDVAHLYLGAKVKSKFGDISSTEIIKGVLGSTLVYDFDSDSDDVLSSSHLDVATNDDKPILIPLANISTEDLKTWREFTSPTMLSMDEMKGQAAATRFLLQQKYDLFGLIENGYAIDGSKLNKN